VARGQGLGFLRGDGWASLLRCSSSWFFFFILGPDFPKTELALKRTRLENFMYLGYDIRLQARSMMVEAAVAASVSAIARKTVSRENQPGRPWRRTSHIYEEDD
jgi:hypothetical protein